MADIRTPSYSLKNSYAGHAPVEWTEYFKMRANAVATGDRILFGITPQGLQITDAFIVSDAAVTLDVGYEPVDEDAPPAVVDAFFKGAAVPAGGRTNSTFHPINLQRRMRIVGTVKAGTLTADQALTLTLRGKAMGPI